MIWDTSAEEDKYLAEVRREKESFERLIKERAVSLSNIYSGTIHLRHGRAWSSCYKRNQILLKIVQKP